jgi:hypothetical protein
LPKVPDQSSEVQPKLRRVYKSWQTVGTSSQKLAKVPKVGKQVAKAKKFQIQAQPKLAKVSDPGATEVGNNSVSVPP